MFRLVIALFLSAVVVIGGFVILVFVTAVAVMCRIALLVVVVFAFAFAFLVLATAVVGTVACVVYKIMVLFFTILLAGLFCTPVLGLSGEIFAKRFWFRLWLCKVRLTKEGSGGKSSDRGGSEDRTSMYFVPGRMYRALCSLRDAAR